MAVAVLVHLSSTQDGSVPAVAGLWGAKVMRPVHCGSMPYNLVGDLIEDARHLPRPR
jgi:hypothetical protein